MPPGLETIMQVCLALALIAWVLALVCALYGRPRAAWAGTMGGTAALVFILAILIWHAQRPPLMGVWEICTQSAVILGLLAWRSLLSPEERRAGVWSLVWGLSLLGFMLLHRPDPAPDSFMYDYPWLILFFQGRIWSMALFFHGAAHYLAAPPGAPGQGRLFLLAGLSVFLLSEFSGAWWSFHWTGQFWHWNRGFLESSLLFMLAAVPLHLPKRWSKVAGIKRLAAILPGAGVTLFTLMRQVG